MTDTRSVCRARDFVHVLLTRLIPSDVTVRHLTCSLKAHKREWQLAALGEKPLDETRNGKDIADRIARRSSPNGAPSAATYEALLLAAASSPALGAEERCGRRSFT